MSEYDAEEDADAVILGTIANALTKEPGEKLRYSEVHPDVDIFTETKHKLMWNSFKKGSNFSLVELAKMQKEEED